MRWMAALGALLLAGVVSVPVRAEDAPVLKVGDKAPDFKLKASDGKEYTLSQFKGKSAVVIAWYPKAMTRGCTAECNSLRDEKAALTKYKVEYFGASVDTVELNKQFSDMNKYNFPLLCDPDKSYAKQLGVINPANGLASRWTFIIDDQGVIKEIDKQVMTAAYGKDLAAKMETLGIPKR